MFHSAAEFAREVGVDRTTVRKWIIEGKLPGFQKHRKRAHYKIQEMPLYKIKGFNKPYPKWQNRWSASEENIIRYSKLKDKDIATIVKRSVGSLRVHKTIMRKKGLL